MRLYPPARVLGLTEGIETAIAVQVATGMPVWATTSGALLRSAWIPAAHRGRRDLGRQGPGGTQGGQGRRRRGCGPTAARSKFGTRNSRSSRATGTTSCSRAASMDSPSATGARDNLNEMRRSLAGAALRRPHEDIQPAASPSLVRCPIPGHARRADSHRKSGSTRGWGSSASTTGYASRRTRPGRSPAFGRAAWKTAITLSGPFTAIPRRNSSTGR